MKTKRFIVGGAACFCVVLLSVPASSQVASSIQTAEANALRVAPTISLQEALASALITHPSVRQATYLVEQREAEERIIRSDGRPVIEYSLQPGYNPQSNRDAVLQLNVSGRVPVYDFGQLRARRNAAESRTDQYRFLHENREEGVAFELVNEFLQYALWNDAVEAAELHLEQLMVIRVRIEMRVAAGLADVSDLRRTDVSIRRATLQRDQVRNQRDTAADAVRAIAHVQGRPEGTLEGIAAALKVTDLPILTDVNEIPSLAAALAEWEASREDVAAARASRYPGISVGVANNSYVMDDRTDGPKSSAFENRSQFGVFLTGRMSLGGGARHQIAAATAASEAAQSSYQTEVLRLDMALNALRRKREEAAVRTQTTGQVISVLEQARDLYWQEYILSKRQLSEVFEIEREIYQSRVDRLQGRADEISAIAEQLGVQGQLVSTLQIPGRERGGQ